MFQVLAIICDSMEIEKGNAFMDLKLRHYENTDIIMKSKETFEMEVGKHSPKTHFSIWAES